MSDVWFDNNDHRVYLDELKDPDGNFLNSAAVNCTIVDENDDEVPGITWPVTLNYVAGSDGRYEALLEGALITEVGDRMFIYVKVTTPGIVSQWKGKLLVKERTF